MIEPLFASNPPMWTPPAAFGFQTPMSVQPAVPTAVFGSSGIPGASGGLNAGLTPSGFYGSSLYGMFPGASVPLTPLVGMIGPETMAGVPAPAIVATVAMRRGRPQGPATEQEAEDFIYDALELLPGTSDVEVRCEGGRATLTGSVQHKRIKRDVGEIAWAIPGLQDVQNNVTITSRRRMRSPAGRETDATSSARKQG